MSKREFLVANPRASSIFVDTGNNLAPLTNDVEDVTEDQQDEQEDQQDQLEVEVQSEEYEEQSEEFEKGKENNVCDADELNYYLTTLVAAFNTRAEALLTSKKMNKEMYECKKHLNAYMKFHKQKRLALTDEKKYYICQKVQKNRGSTIKDLYEAIERDYGKEKANQYRTELAELAKTKVTRWDSRITYVGKRTLGEHNPGAAPKRKRNPPKP